ncbi:ferredoxin reductase family protein [Sinomonas sp. JGH33]|uniref:Ferredoxin reductase family protein n=1 Tax=Sinomonas terricola TaxID=3110330 RepID=A0ABU5T809_9MICC|nr:ferredoxin reductase family protein [Sinomonas sp. JGH33]MEA5455675.1 ferredoxin reductase family protein [Sinomonas sp. JGH33]
MTTALRSSERHSRPPGHGPGAALAETLRDRGRRRLFREDALTVLAWASGAAAVALYLADGGAAQFHGLSPALTAIGVVAGLIGTDLVLVMLLLAARIPLIDRAIGHDRAMAVHGKLGKPALYLILAHMVFLLLGYGVTDGLNPIAEGVSMWVNLPDMWLAFLSIVLFLAVVVTSLVAVRRRFPYEFWYVVHLLTYAAVLTALPHQFSVGGLFADGQWQRWYWIAFYILVLAALVRYRIWAPIALTFRHQLTVQRVEPAGDGAVNIELTGLRLEELAGSGGRFFIWRFLAPGLWWHHHPFSLSADPAAGSLRITVRNLGRGSASLMAAKPGTKVSLSGPHGLFGHAARTRPGLVLVGSGIGITPLRAILERAEFAPGHATVILRGSTQGTLYLRDEIAELCRQKGATLYELVGHRARSGNTWLPRHQSGLRLADYVANLAESDLYVCGPTTWADSVLADAKASGLSDEQLHHERFDW